MRKFNEIFRKYVNYDNFKSHKKQCFALYLEDTFFEKLQVEVKLTSPSLFGANQHCQYLNLPTFSQSSQSNQLFLKCLVEFLSLYVDCIGLLIYLVLFNNKFDLNTPNIYVINVFIE